MKLLPHHQIAACLALAVFSVHAADKNDTEIPDSVYPHATGINQGEKIIQSLLFYGKTDWTAKKGSWDYEFPPLGDSYSSPFFSTDFDNLISSERAVRENFNLKLNTALAKCEKAIRKPLCAGATQAHREEKRRTCIDVVQEELSPLVGMPITASFTVVDVTEFSAPAEGNAQKSKPDANRGRQPPEKETPSAADSLSEAKRKEIIQHAYTAAPYLVIGYFRSTSPVVPSPAEKEELEKINTEYDRRLKELGGKDGDAAELKARSRQRKELKDSADRKREEIKKRMDARQSYILVYFMTGNPDVLKWKKGQKVSSPCGVWAIRADDEGPYSYESHGKIQHGFGGVIRKSHNENNDVEQDVSALSMRAWVYLLDQGKLKEKP